MSEFSSIDITPNWQALNDCLLRKGTPDRAHVMELYLDAEQKDAICKRFHLLDGLDEDDSFFHLRREIILQRFLGYDYVSCGLGLEMILPRGTTVQDTAELERSGGREFLEEHAGPITNWEEFRAYSWPEIESASASSLEWYSENLPDDMCIIGGSAAHFSEHLHWLMGYETLCYALYDQRDLVRALSTKFLELSEAVLKRVLEFDRVKMVWGSDDMGFRSGTLISPGDMREFILPGHKRAARMCHDAGRLYLLHSCGDLSEIMEDLIDDVRIDGKHSFEDTIENVVEAKAEYGDRVSLIGGIDMDFICRATEEEVRRRVRDTLVACQPGGGYCLGTGNTVANYVPLNNYLAMLDEGRRFTV